MEKQVILAYNYSLLRILTIDFTGKQNQCLKFKNELGFKQIAIKAFLPHKCGIILVSSCTCTI